jgi:hypothetical protein
MQSASTPQNIARSPETQLAILWWLRWLVAAAVVVVAVNSAAVELGSLKLEKQGGAFSAGFNNGFDVSKICVSTRSIKFCFRQPDL